MCEHLNGNISSCHFIWFSVDSLIKVLKIGLSYIIWAVCELPMGMGIGYM